MRRIPFPLSSLACLPFLAAPLLAQSATDGSPATVILISLDGTRPDAGDHGLSVLLEFGRRGTLASRLVPVFPTNTFPNHVTLATGVHPARHGIVDNRFSDSERGTFDKSDDPTWIDCEPIWSIAARHGIVSASFHFVGSEGPWRSGRGPRYWKPFDPRTPASEKVEQILAWLDLPDGRPQLITSWFPGADAAGHRSGPHSRAVRRALAEQDAALSVLLSGIAQRGAWRATTLLLVSDHGMAEVARRVDLSAALREAGLPARVQGAGGYAGVEVAGGRAAARRAAEVARGLGLEAWLRGDAPAELGLEHRRASDLAVLAPLGVAIAPRLARLKGSHGYRAELPEMGALFAALGRGVPAGGRLAEVRAVDVAPTVLALLGIAPPAWMEGRPVSSLLDGIPAPGGGS